MGNCELFLTYRTGTLTCLLSQEPSLQSGQLLLLLTTAPFPVKKNMTEAQPWKRMEPSCETALARFPQTQGGSWHHHFCGNSATNILHQQVEQLSPAQASGIPSFLPARFFMIHSWWCAWKGNMNTIWFRFFKQSHKILCFNQGFKHFGSNPFWEEVHIVFVRLFWWLEKKMIYISN